MKKGKDDVDSDSDKDEDDDDDDTTSSQLTNCDRDGVPLGSLYETVCLYQENGSSLR